MVRVIGLTLQFDVRGDGHHGIGSAMKFPSWTRDPLGISGFVGRDLPMHIHPAIAQIPFLQQGTVFLGAGWIRTTLTTTCPTIRPRIGSRCWKKGHFLNHQRLGQAP